MKFKINRFWGGIWIASWFLGIWIFHLQFFLTGLFALYIAWLTGAEV